MKNDEIINHLKTFCEEEIKQAHLLILPHIFHLRVQMEATRLKMQGVKCSRIKAYRLIEDIFYTFYGKYKYSSYDSYRMYVYRKNKC